MLKLLGIDFEAQDENPLTTLPTEVGAILVELDGPVMTKVEELSTLLYDDQLMYKPQSELVEALTGISDKDLKERGVKPHGFFVNKLIPLMVKADFIIAHNKKYDQRLFESFCKRFGISYPDKTWICSYTEIPYDTKYTCKKLSHLALDHGILMDGRVLHRATADVELMLELVQKYSFEVILAYASQPWVFLKIDTPAPWTDGGRGVAFAKTKGYNWQICKGTDEPVFDKSWVKRVKLNQLDEELSLTTDYRIVQIKGTI